MEINKIIDFYKEFHKIESIDENHKIDIDCLVEFEQLVISRVNVLTKLARQSPQANKDVCLVQFSISE